MAAGQDREIDLERPGQRTADGLHGQVLVLLAPDHANWNLGEAQARGHPLGLPRIETSRRVDQALAALFSRERAEKVADGAQPPGEHRLQPRRLRRVPVADARHRTHRPLGLIDAVHQHQLTDPLRPQDGQDLRRRGPHVVGDERDAVDPALVEQLHEPAGLVLHADVGSAGRVAVAEQIRGQDAEPGGGEPREHVLPQPAGGGEPVHEQGRGPASGIVEREPGHFQTRRSSIRLAVSATAPVWTSPRTFTASRSASATRATSTAAPGASSSTYSRWSWWWSRVTTAWNRAIPGNALSALSISAPRMNMPFTFTASPTRPSSPASFGAVRPQAHRAGAAMAPMSPVAQRR